LPILPIAYQSHCIDGEGLTGGREFGGCGTSNLSATEGTHRDYGVFSIRRCVYLHAKQLLEKVWGDHDMNKVLE
jgi:hypothetical protein